MDALLLVRRVARGMVTAAGAAGIGEAEDPLAARLNRRRLGLASARGPALKILPAVARRDQAPGAAVHSPAPIVTAVFAQRLRRRTSQRTSERGFDPLCP